MKTLLTAIFEMPWALLPAKLAALIAVVERHEAGVRLTAEEVQARIGSSPAAGQASAGNVAILRLFGTIFPRANLMTETSGATSAERWAAQFRQLVADTNVGAIVIDTDSPGGAVQGVDELSAEIYRARGQKPIVAVANHLAASAAYWIATAADELVVTPSGQVGSIGVFAAHEDVSRAADTAGVKTTLISAGKFKVEANPYEPLTEEARAAIQARVDEYYSMFVRAVARNRGVPVEAVRSGFGEGRVVGAREAVKLGMADRVATLDEVVAGLQRQAARRSPAAELDFRQRRARALED